MKIVIPGNLAQSQTVPLPGLVATKISKNRRLGVSPREGFLFYCSIIPGSRKEKVINGK